MQNCVIFLIGKKGVGKDTAADYFKACKIAYGDALKDIAHELLISFYGSNIPISRNDMDDPIKKELEYPNYTFRDEPLTIRKVLQHVGTEIFRKTYADLWVQIVINKVKNRIQQGYKLILITDCRFPNEVTLTSDCLKDLCTFITIKIERPTLQNDQHSSETSMDNFNTEYTIQNDGTLEEFYGKLSTVSLPY